MENLELNDLGKIGATKTKLNNFKISKKDFTENAKSELLIQSFSQRGYMFMIPRKCFA